MGQLMLIPARDVTGHRSRQPGSYNQGAQNEACNISFRTTTQGINFY